MEYKKIFGYVNWPVKLFIEVSAHRRFFYFILLNTHFFDKILSNRNVTSKWRRIDVDVMSYCRPCDVITSRRLQYDIIATFVPAELSSTKKTSVFFVILWKVIKMGKRFHDFAHSLTGDLLFHTMPSTSKTIPVYTDSFCTIPCLLI